MNACDPVFNVSVRLDGGCVSSDSHPVDNLVSPDPRLRQKGFLAAGFVRPPVSVTVRLPCAFDIKYAVIGTRVGGQKSSGFQLFAGRGDGRDARKICSAVTDRGSIVFHNNTADLSGFGDDHERSCFFISAGRHARSVDTLTVRVFRTANASVPGIGKLEVWGNVSGSAPASVRRALTRLWEVSRARSTGRPGHSAAVRTEIAAETPRAVDPVGTVCDDFLDAITCEVMTCPVALPGGKYVDRSTVEKCAAYDGAYGRAPCDPFTGVPYTDALRPVPVPELKGRIEAYLAEHADDASVARLPRALGKRGLSFYTERQAKVPKTLCSRCGKDDDQQLYRLPCEHVRCRDCALTANKVDQCGVCQTRFDRSQVEKYHRS